VKEYPVDPERIRLMEQTARDIAAALGRATAQNNKKFAGEKWGFALFLFSFGERGEMTYVSNADREDMIKMLLEFIAKQPPAKTWDEQHG
jgi:hypothetical protein